ncbi:flagellar protein flag protein [Trichococcus palustris]|uniref:Flagellar protein flag protein n=1 Tax=Trichococcus palustris TaxID=140314 RepID=A0A143YZT6_9LACT|nr:flagellar protein FlaG [Trichococcus palustris]CZR02654.1 flagellar protein flag protein [Trichococcus palustris]SFL13713.1 flagellar protein FlaG [Trichococcus palustris]
MDPLQAVRRILFDTPHYYPVVKATAPKRDTDAVQEEPKTDPEADTVSREALAKAVDEANGYIVGWHAEFRFRIHEGTGRTLVQILDTQTKEVIKELPPEKMLDIVADLWKNIGITVDRTE